MKGLDGELTTWKAIVDKAIADGFSEVQSQRKGATSKFFLVNPTTNLWMAVQRKDGSLDYAELALADRAAALQQAAPVPDTAHTAEPEMAQGEVEPARERQRA